MSPILPAAPVSDYLHYEYRADLQVLVGRWLRQPTEAETHVGYYALLAAAEAIGARRWLLDARRRENANQHIVGWMVEQFLPLLAQRLPSPVYLAFLFMPTHLTELEQDVSLPLLASFNTRPYHAERFIEEQLAMRWLEAVGQMQ
jgi:hypothetical protein